MIDLKRMLLVLWLVAVLMVSPSYAQVHQTFGGFTLQNAAVATGNGQAVSIGGYTTLILDVTIATTATVTFEGVADSTFTAAGCAAIGTGTLATTATASGLFRCNVAAFTGFRARVSAWTSGAVTVKGYLTTATAASSQGAGGGSADGLGAATDLTDLTATTSVVGTDLAYVVVDPGGTPLRRKITVANLFTSPTFVTPVLGAATGTSLALTAAGAARIRLRDSGAESTSYWDIRAQNYVWSAVNDHTFGINFNETGDLTTHPQWGENYESRYVDGAPPLGLFERNWSYTSIDRLTTYRPFNFNINLNNSKGNMRWILDKWSVHAPADIVGTDESLYVSTANKAVSIANLNIGVISDAKPFPLYVAKIAGTAGVAVNPTNAVTGNNMFLTQPNAITGNVMWFAAESSATGEGGVMLRNTGAGLVNILLWAGSGGDSQIRFLAATDWSIGNDRSDAGKFKISNSNLIGNNDRLTITAAGAVAIPSGNLTETQVETITGGVTDGYSAALRLDPGYTAATALTVDRHNYIDLQNVSVAGAGPAALTDAAVFRFDAAAGTHKATLGATTKTTPGAVDAWIKININGTLHYIPSYTSSTS